MAFYSLPLQAGDRILTARRRVRQQLHRAPAGRASAPAPRSWSCPTTSTARSTSTRSTRDARRARASSSRSPTCRPRAGSSSPPPRSARVAPRGRASRCCSTPASRSGSCRSTSTRSAATCSPRPGRKFLRGPRGTGFLYVRRGLIEHARAAVPRPPRRRVDSADGSYVIRPDARRFENWETNYRDEDRARRGGRLRARDRPRRDRGPRARAGGRAARAARRAPGVTVHDRGEERSAIVTFTVEGAPARRRGRRPARQRRQHLRLPGHLRPAGLRRPRPRPTSSAPRRTTTTRSPTSTAWSTRSSGLRVVVAEAALAAVLGHVHRDVGVAHELVRADARSGHGRGHAEARLDVERAGPRTRAAPAGWR